MLQNYRMVTREIKPLNLPYDESVEFPRALSTMPFSLFISSENFEDRDDNWEDTYFRINCGSVSDPILSSVLAACEETRSPLAFLLETTCVVVVADAHVCVFSATKFE